MTDKIKNGGDNGPAPKVGAKKAKEIGEKVGVLVEDARGRLAAVHDLGRVTWLDGTAEITTLRQRLAESEARCAELEHNADAVVYADSPDNELARMQILAEVLKKSHSGAYLLRTQAEAVERMASLVKEAIEARLATPETIYEGLVNNVVSLRTWADELERQQ